MRRRTVEKAVGDPRLRFYAGEGYFYFVWDDGVCFVDSTMTGHSVYVSQVSALSLDQWVEAAREFIAAAEDMQGGM